MAKLASQIICGNHTGNCHSKPIVGPTVNGGFVGGKKGLSRKADGRTVVAYAAAAQAAVSANKARAIQSMAFRRQCGPAGARGGSDGVSIAAVYPETDPYQLARMICEGRPTNQSS